MPNGGDTVAVGVDRSDISRLRDDGAEPAGTIQLIAYDPFSVPKRNGCIGFATVTAPEGVLVYRTDDRAKAPTVEGWEGPGTHVYGGMALHFYQRPE